MRLSRSSTHPTNLVQCTNSQVDMLSRQIFALMASPTFSPLSPSAQRQSSVQKGQEGELTSHRRRQPLCEAPPQMLFLGDFSRKVTWVFGGLSSRQSTSRRDRLPFVRLWRSSQTAGTQDRRRQLRQVCRGYPGPLQTPWYTLPLLPLEGCRQL
jgi:hypothetical protein